MSATAPAITASRRRWRWSSSSAVAKIPCKAIGLDEKQFYAALRKKPAFALMLMSVMIGRAHALPYGAFAVDARGKRLPDYRP